jgi:uncharacterized membrane protein YeaQ/YmgE (transglycosylase-associated protein family)
VSILACIIWGLFIGWVAGDIIEALQRIAVAMEQKQEKGRQSW